MSEKNLKQRDQIPQEYKWNIEDMYPDESLWEKDVDECIKRAENFKDFSGKLTESPQTLLSALRERDSIWQKLEHAFVYAAMKKTKTTEWINIRPWTINAAARWLKWRQPCPSSRLNCWRRPNPRY